MLYSIILCSVDNIKVTMYMIIGCVYFCYCTVNASRVNNYSCRAYGAVHGVLKYETAFVMATFNAKKLHPRGEGKNVYRYSVSFNC